VDAAQPDQYSAYPTHPATPPSGFVMVRVRDHAKEYARRTREARAQAEKTGQRPDLRAARGHGGKAAKAPKPPSKPATPPPPSKGSGKPGPFRTKLLSTITRADLPDVPPPLRKGGRRQKALSELSPAYRRRIERAGLKAGESRQKARGHTPDEARRRKEPPATTLTGALTRGQKSYLHAFFNREIASRRRDWTKEQLATEWQHFLAVNTEAGWERARLQMRRQGQLAAAYKRVDNKSRSLGYRAVDLQAWGAADGWDNWTWFWYH
jgi:hypothetical protein